MSAVRPSLVHRPNRTTLASLLSVLLIVAGTLGLWMLIGLLSTGDWPAQADSAATSVGSAPSGSAAVIASAVIGALLGLVFLLAALVPGRRARSVLDIEGGAPGECAMSHKDISRRVRSAVRRVDGVDGVRVAVRRGRVRVRVTTPVYDAAPVRRACENTTADALAELALTPKPRLAVSVRSGQ